jgi:hypothetical protein
MSQLFLFVVSERAAALFSSSELAQMDQDSRTDKIHSMGLPRIMGPQFSDDYPVSPLHRR